MTRRSVYPHVEAIQDWSAQQTIRLLWDEVHALRQEITGRAVAASTEARLSALETQLQQTQTIAETALITAGQETTDLPSTP